MKDTETLKRILRTVLTESYDKVLKAGYMKKGDGSYPQHNIVVPSEREKHVEDMIKKFVG